MTDALRCQDFFVKYITGNFLELKVLEILSFIIKWHQSEFINQEIVYKISEYFETKSYQDETETNFTRGENPKLWWQMAVKFKHFNFHILRQFIFIKLAPANLFKMPQVYENQLLLFFFIKRTCCFVFCKIFFNR